MKPRSPMAAVRDRLRRALVTAATLAFAGLHSVEAQEPVDPVLRGQLVRAGVPADSGTVLLHQISPDGGAAIDSARVNPDGSFSFRLPGLPIPETNIYFLTSEFDGVLYYSQGPVALPVQLDTVQTLAVYPTEPAPAQGLQFPILLREITLAEGPLGWTVTDAFILVNELEVTFVPAGDAGTVWSYPLPGGAVAPRVIESEVWPPGPVSIEEGRVRAANPVVPGSASYMLQYDVATLPLDIPMPGEVRNARVFLREPAPEIRVEGMAARGPVEVEEGVTFLAWEAVNVADQGVRVALGAERAPSVSIWLTAALALLLVGAGSWVVARRPAPAEARRSTRLRKDILVEIARLDEEFRSGGEAEGPSADLYRARRGTLLRELQEAGPADGP